MACSKETKKSPSLTQFAEATMPRGKGRKGSQCPRTRKASVPTTAVLQNPSISHCPSASGFNQQVSTPVSVNVDPTCSPSTSGPPAASSSQTNNLQLPSVTQHLQVIVSTAFLPSASMVIWISRLHDTTTTIRHCFNKIHVVGLGLHIYCRTLWGTSVCVPVAGISTPNSQLHLMTYVSDTRNGAYLYQQDVRPLSHALAMSITISTHTVCGCVVQGLFPLF